MEKLVSVSQYCFYIFIYLLLCRAQPKNRVTDSKNVKSLSYYALKRALRLYPVLVLFCMNYNALYAEIVDPLLCPSSSHIPPRFSPSFFLATFYIPDKWSPALQIRTVLLSIQALLSAPNPDDPLANDVAEQWKTNEAQAIETGGI